MPYLFIFFFFTGLAYSQKKPECQKANWLNDLKKGVNLARRNHCPIILDLYAPWCGYCRKLQNQIYPSSQVSLITKKFIRVRIDGEKQPEVMRRYQAQGFPTIVLLDHNGAYMDSITGLPKRSSLVRKLTDIHKRFAKKQNRVLQALQKNPQSVEANFIAGKYYFGASSYDQARQHFLKCWRLSKKSKLNARTKSTVKKALYNSAVSSMHLRQYGQAYRHWDTYLRKYRQQDREFIYAHYYRGLSLYYQNKKKQAQADLAFAAKHLRHPQDRYMAQSLAKSISQ